MMKSISLGLLLIVLLGGLSSCSKDDDPVAVDDDEVQTPWYHINECSGNSPYVIRSQWGDLHPVFRFDSSLPSSWRDPAEWSGSQWNNAGSNLEIRVNRTVVNSGSSHDGLSVISRGPLAGGKLGECQKWIDVNTGKIVEADIVLNENMPLSLGRSTDYYDVQSILTHEFGHFCGLDHVGDRTHTMYPSTPKDCIIYRSLCQGDKLGVKVIYGVGD